MVELNTKALIKYKNKIKEYEDVLKLTPEEQNIFDDLKTKAIEEAFEQGKLLADEVTKALFKSPINLEFEKVYSPFLILSKKRYIGNYYGKDPYTIDMVEKKGVVLKRRDNANIVKKIYNGVIDPLLEHGERGVNISIDFLKTELGKLMNHDVDLDDLVVCKSLAKGYGKIVNGNLIKNEGDYASNNLPHVALAIKMRDRDPGSAPNIGDRINYVITETDDPRAKIYEKSESPEVVKEKNLKIDYLYYINNQIRNPVDEVLQILVSDSSKIFDDVIENTVKVRNEQIKQSKIKAKNKLEPGQLSILHWIKPKEN
jgi:DNA polymerase delta subunit 1